MFMPEFKLGVLMMVKVIDTSDDGAAGQPTSETPAMIDF